MSTHIITSQYNFNSTR